MNKKVDQTQTIVEVEKTEEKVETGSTKNLQTVGDPPRCKMLKWIVIAIVGIVICVPVYCSLKERAQPSEERYKEITWKEMVDT